MSDTEAREAELKKDLENLQEELDKVHKRNEELHTELTRENDKVCAVRGVLQDVIGRLRDALQDLER